MLPRPSCHRASAGIRMTTAEENARGQIAQVERHRGEVSERGPERKGRENRCPVEGLPSLGRDAVNGQRALAALPDPEDRGQDDGPQQGRPGIGDMDIEMQEIRDSGPGDRDRVRQEPVRKRSIATGRKLQQQPDDDHQHLGAATLEVAVRLQVVRRGLTTGGRQDLHDPEDKNDLRDLRRDRSGKEATHQRDQPVARARVPGGYRRGSAITASGTHAAEDTWATGLPQRHSRRIR